MAKRKKMKMLADNILVYQCDVIDGEPIFAVAKNVNEISEDFDGEAVGVYVLNHQYKFTVKRSLA